MCKGPGATLCLADFKYRKEGDIIRVSKWECGRRWKATGGLEQERRMSPSDLYFNRSMLVIVSKGRSRKTN